MTIKVGVAAAAIAQPVIWSLLGYQFEAASMIAGLIACLMSRIWVSLQDRSSKLWAWCVDLIVTGISMLFTAGWVVMNRPSPFYALLSGTGFGALGAGIIVIALAWIRRMEPIVTIENDEAAALRPPSRAADVTEPASLGSGGRDE